MEAASNNVQKAIDALADASASLRSDTETNLEKALLAEEIDDILRRLRAIPRGSGGDSR